MKSLLLVAGEYSGDMHASDVVRELKKQNSELDIWGIGGEKLRAENVETLHDIKEMDVVGVAEIIPKYSFFKRVFNEVLEEVDKRKPEAALLVDYPGFNLRLAKQLKKRGVKVFYYICPQVWAWNRSRIPKMAKIIDQLMVIFPFEVDVFKGVDIKVDFVGHPMVDELRAFRNGAFEPLPWKAEKKIAMLPGSRKGEISYILEPLLETAKNMEEKQPELSFIIPVPQRRLKLVEQIVQNVAKKPKNLSVITDNSREVLRQADAAFVASGTATLEAALLGCPTVLVYRANLLNYFFGKLVIKVKWLGIANIISNREIMPECLQAEVNPKTLEGKIIPLIGETPQRAQMLENFKELETQLGSGAPAVRVAQIVCG